MNDGLLKLPCILNGRQFQYTVRQVIGQGSFGITYLATTPVKGPLGEINVQVAIKEFFPKELSTRQEDGSVLSSSSGVLSAKYAEAFKKEALKLSSPSLRHEGIIHVLEYFEANGTGYYSMEYLPGGSLDDKIKGKGLPEKEALALIGEISRALGHMHKNGMMHLDLKPKNIMLKSNGSPVLIDFGLTKQYDKDGEPESSSSIGLGTPGYSPLEQMNSSGRHLTFSPTIDIYALGGTLYKMLIGVTPPNASYILNEGFDEAPLIKKGVSMATIDLVKRAMSPAYANRPQTVDEFISMIPVLERDDSASEEDSRDCTPVPSKGKQVAQNKEIVKDSAKGNKNKISSPGKTPVSSANKAKEPKHSIKINLKTVKKIAFGCALFLLLAGTSFWLYSASMSAKLRCKRMSSLGWDRLYEEAVFVWKKYDIVFKMFQEESGSFRKGATPEQGADASLDEYPVTDVEMDNYWIATTEVSQRLWNKIMGYNPSDYYDPDDPVTNVSYDECLEFVERLNSIQSYATFCIPSEDQWEYAARGGDEPVDTKYCGSDDIDKVAWYNENSNSTVHECGLLDAINYMLYDMSGNVREWVSTNYSPRYDSDKVSGDYVLRGGAWNDSAKNCRVSSRSHAPRTFKDEGTGLRLAASSINAKYGIIRY